MSYPKDCQPSTTGVEVRGGLEGKAYCTPFDPDWPHGHVTRDGRKARIICRDVNTSAFPILALITKEHSDGSSSEYITSYRADGGFRVEARFGESPEDLINAPAPKRKFLVRVAVNDRGEALASPWFDRRSQEGAVELFARPVIAWKTFEVEEGEGL